MYCKNGKGFTLIYLISALDRDWETSVEADNCPLTVKIFVESLKVKSDDAAKAPAPSLNCI